MTIKNELSEIKKLDLELRSNYVVPIKSDRLITLIILLHDQLDRDLASAIYLKFMEKLTDSLSIDKKVNRKFIFNDITGAGSELLRFLYDFTFYKKLGIARTLGLLPEEVLKTFEKANYYRNKLMHENAEFEIDTKTKVGRKNRLKLLRAFKRALDMENNVSHSYRY